MKSFFRIFLLAVFQLPYLYAFSQAHPESGSKYVEKCTIIYNFDSKVYFEPYRLIRDSIINLSGYQYSYRNYLILGEDTVDQCIGQPMLLTDSIPQKYEVINIRKNPLRHCPKYQCPNNQKLLYIIDVADTLHLNVFSLFSFKNKNVKKVRLQRVKVGNVYDMIIYRADCPPLITGIPTSGWSYIPFANLDIDRTCCKVYPIVISPNMTGLYYYNAPQY